MNAARQLRKVECSLKAAWIARRRRRYTNFVEMGFAVFRRAALLRLMAAYASRADELEALLGYGIDWWYTQTLGIHRPDPLSLRPSAPLALSPSAHRYRVAPAARRPPPNFLLRQPVEDD